MSEVQEWKNTLFGSCAPIQTFPITSDPSPGQNRHKLREFIAQADHLSLILLQLPDLSLLRNLYGESFFRQLREMTVYAVGQAAARSKHDHFRKLGISMYDSGEFGILSHDVLESNELLDWAFSLRMEVQRELKSWLLKNTGLQLRILVGCDSALITNSSPERELMKIMSTSRKMCSDRLDTNQLSLASEFQYHLRRSGQFQIVQ